MRQSDAAIAALDAKTDAAAPSTSASAELFAVVDLLDEQPGLRRSLSDPAASPDDRAALAQRLLGSRISAGALSIVDAAVRSNWASQRKLVSALERQGVRGCLRAAKADGSLAQVQSELYAVANAISGDVELSDTLRSRAYPVSARRELLGKLTAGKVSAITATLLDRATAARARTVPLTIDRYLEQSATITGEQIARVTVAQPLDAERLERLRRALEKQVNGPVSVQVTVDPAVLGGVSVQLGDEIIESTVAGRLHDARRLLTTI